jgi:hypothetical protein
MTEKITEYKAPHEKFDKEFEDELDDEEFEEDLEDAEEYK